MCAEGGCAVWRHAGCGVWGDGCRLVTTFSCCPGGWLKVTTPSPCGFPHEWISSFGSWCISKLCMCVSKTKLCSHRCAQHTSPNVHTHKYWSLFVHTLVTPRIQQILWWSTKRDAGDARNSMRFTKSLVMRMCQVLQHCGGACLQKQRCKRRGRQLWVGLAAFLCLFVVIVAGWISAETF